jgi:competence protein ComEC
VGQGSSNLIEFPAGKRALIDGGGPSSPRFNTGESVIAPFLWRKGITTIDSVVITHPDSDHFNGLPFIIKHFDPKILWINGSIGHGPGYTELLRLAQKLHIALCIPDKNAPLLTGGGSTLSLITNPLMARHHASNGATGKQEESISSNDSGIIVKFTDHYFSALFPGDISKRVEQLLVQHPKTLSADVLLSPHHGSATSNSTVFLQAVRPSYLIVSSGYRKKGIFPAWNLKEKSKKLGSKMLTTALSGCIVVTTDGVKFSVATGDGIANMKKIAVRVAAK